MTDVLKSLSELLRLNWRNAFAICAAGMTVLVLRPRGYLGDDYELVIGALTAFGGWVLVAIGIEKIWKRIVACLRARRIKTLQTERDADTAKKGEAAQKAADEAEALKRKRTLDNLRYLHHWEQQALTWIYHNGGRARASINHSGIDALSEHGLLVAEDRNQLATDRFWGIPDFVMDEFQKVIGEPDPNKGRPPAPWEGKATGWRV
jgi:hypothetical protein